MKKLFILSLLFVLPVLLFSQTSNEIRREAYPDLVNVTDNSDYANLLGRLTDAKKSGNITEFNALLNELNSKYLDKGNGLTSGKQLPANGNIFIPTMTHPEESNFTPDWANGENRIFTGNVGTSSPGNPNPHNRQVKIEADSMGTLYVAFLSGAKDSLIYYRSTNRGTTWTKIQSIFSGVDYIYHSFDFAVTDTTGGFKIGMTVSITAAVDPLAGSIYYADMLSDGSGFSSNGVLGATSGRGLVGPVICTDGYNWSPGTTYWYIACQNVDAVTGVTNFVPCAYTPNWGSTWVQDTARSSFNDYELDIDYNFDSVYVLLVNNLTLTNSNLRLRYTALSNWGTNVAWKQFNPAGESFHEYNSCLAVNRKTNSMVITYTTNESSNLNIKYSYAANGSNWIIQNVLTNQANNESRSYISGSNQQSGAFRVVWVSSGTSFDSVFYMSTTNIASGFVSKTLVSRVNQSTGVLAPCVTGLMFNGTTPGGGVIYAGSGPSNIWYNGSDLLTEINPVSATVPEKFSLSQNYPNPFNPVTKINFSIPKNNLVTIKVYNSIGKEVAVLVNDTYNAGEYEVSFNAANLASGLYFYKISSGDFSDTKKMMLIK